MQSNLIFNLESNVQFNLRQNSAENRSRKTNKKKHSKKPTQVINSATSQTPVTLTANLLLNCTRTRWEVTCTPIKLLGWISSVKLKSTLELQRRSSVALVSLLLSASILTFSATVWTAQCFPLRWIQLKLELSWLKDFASCLTWLHLFCETLFWELFSRGIFHWFN